MNRQSVRRTTLHSITHNINIGYKTAARSYKYSNTGVKAVCLCIKY